VVAGATPERLPVVLLPCTLAGYVPAGSRARRRATARHPHNNAGSYDGDLAGALRGADVFIGVSAPDILTGDDVAAMAADAIVFALANPVPEVDPDAAGEHAAVVATGRSDYPNQINNVLAFPGVFRGRSMRRAGRSPMTCWPPRPARWPAWCPRPGWALTTSSRRCSTRTWPRRWPPRSGTRRAGGRPGPSAPSPRPIGENKDVAEILAGRLLVATPLLGDPNFRRSVVLVVEDEPDEGTLGVVLNRPTETPVEQVLESWTDLVTQPSVVFRGGPVSPNSALGLAIVPGEAEPVGWRALDGMTLRSRIGLVDLDAPPQLLEGGIASLRVFAGYAGWGPGQVQAEIEEGAWYVLPAEPADAFAAEPERLWQMVLRRAGGTLALVATYPDDPALN